MLVCLVNWIYVTITTYIFGRFTLPRISRLLNKEECLDFKVFDYIISGFILITAYAGFFSIIYRVRILANLILIIICAIMVFIDRKAYSDSLSSSKSRLMGKTLVSLLPYVLVGIITTILTLMYTADSTFHYDTGLYHAQSIHWIEEYGVVKGMGLLHFRLAYNSTYFPICALCSFKDLLHGQSLHALSGFIAEIVTLYGLSGLLTSIKNKTIFTKTAVSDMLRLSPALCWIVCCMELTSPETDFVVTYLFLWLCIRFVEVAERKASCSTAYCLLAVSTFALIGYKLTSTIMVLVVILPMVMLIKDKNCKNILICGVIAIILILPYLIRNFLISGWLIYPFSGIDIFNVDWKIPKDTLLGDAGAIKQGSQVGNNGVPDGVSMEALGWLRTWWNDNYYATKMFYSTVIMAFPAFGLVILQKVIALIKRKSDKTASDIKSEVSREMTSDTVYILLMFILTLCFVFWFIMGPAIRYGYSFVFTFPFLVCGYIMHLGASSERKGLMKVLAVIVAYAVAFTVMLPDIWSIKPLIQFDYEETLARYSFSDYIVNQLDYPVVDSNSKDWNGETVYYPKEGDQLWYYTFISVPYGDVYDSLEWIGDDIKDGFRIKQ